MKDTHCVFVSGAGYRAANASVENETKGAFLHLFSSGDFWYFQFCLVFFLITGFAAIISLWSYSYSIKYH